MIDVKKLVREMTLEEKDSLLPGLDFWHTKPIMSIYPKTHTSRESLQQFTPLPSRANMSASV